MSKLAHVSGGVITDFPEPLKGFKLEDCFNADFLSACVKVNDAAEVGWTWDGTKASAPATAVVAPLTTVPFLGFLALFTSTEQAAIISSDDPQIKLFCLMAAGATVVDLADLRTVTGTQELEALGLIGKGRAKQVLAGQAPPTS